MFKNNQIPTKLLDQILIFESEIIKLSTKYIASRCRCGRYAKQLPFCLLQPV